MKRKFSRLGISLFFILLIGVVFNNCLTNQLVSAANMTDIKVSVNFSVDSDDLTSRGYDSVTFKSKYVKFMQVSTTTSGTISALPPPTTTEKELTDPKARPQTTANPEIVKLADVALAPKNVTLSASFNLDIPYNIGDINPSDSIVNITTYKYYACIYNDVTKKYDLCSNEINATSKTATLKFEINPKNLNSVIAVAKNANGEDVSAENYTTTVKISGMGEAEAGIVSLYAELKTCDDLTLNASGYCIKSSKVNNYAAFLVDDRNVTRDKDGDFAILESEILKFPNDNTNTHYVVCIKGIEDTCSKIFQRHIEGSGPATPEIIISKEKYTGYSGTVGTNSSVSTCSPEIGGLGWILCPVVNALAQFTDGAYSTIESLLQINPTALFNSDNSTYKVWQQVRNIANVLFVIAFMIIIISQMSGVGITNYGVKKLLPRLIIAAILVNVSFFICQIAVDISNILGVSLKDLLANDVMKEGSNNALVPKYASVASQILGGTVLLGTGAAVGIAVWSALPLLGVALLSAGLAVLVVLLILVARQAIIIMLIVLSPIAFVAYLLPNTSKIFNQWRKMFISLLLIYPAIGAVFGGSVLVAKVLNNAFADQSAYGTILNSIVVATASIIPLFVVPFMLKSSLNAVPMLGKFASDLSKKANSNAAKRFGETYKGTDFARGRALKKKLRSDLRDEKYNDKIASGDYGIPQRLSSGIRRKMGYTDPSALEAKLKKTGERARLAKEAAEKQEEVKVHEAEITSIKATGHTTNGVAYTNHFDYLDDMAKISSGNSEAKMGAAIEILAKTGRDKEVRPMVGNSDYNQSLVQSSIQANVGALITKAPDLIKPTELAYGNVSASQLLDFSADSAVEHIRYLNTLYENASKAGATQEEKDKFNTAFVAYENAIQTIQKDTTMQGKFDGAAGKAILSALEPPADGSVSAFQVFMSKSAAVNAIDKYDGRIH